MTVPITPDQVAALQAKVQKLVDDQADAVAKTLAGNDAKTALLHAQQASADADLAEANADALVSTDLNDLLSFISSITGAQISVTA